MEISCSPPVCSHSKPTYRQASCRHHSCCCCCCNSWKNKTTPRATRPSSAAASSTARTESESRCCNKSLVQGRLIRRRDDTLSEDVGSGPFKGLLIHFWRRKWRMVKSFSNKEINQSNGLRFDNLKHQKLQSSFSISESYFEFFVCVSGNHVSARRSVFSLLVKLQ